MTRAEFFRERRRAERRTAHWRTVATFEQEPEDKGFRLGSFAERGRNDWAYLWSQEWR